MPEYLAPGVFIEETSFRSKSIAGVGTSVAGIVGPTRTGPLRGKPEVVTGFEEFVRVYGDLDDLVLGGTQVPNRTAVAARAFFENGGKQLFVARVVAGVNQANADGSGTSAAAASRTQAADGTTLAIRARFPGAAGNYLLELRWRDSENLLRVDAVTPAVGDTVLITGTITVTAFQPASAPAGLANTDQLQLTAVATRTSATAYTIDGSRVVLTKVADGSNVPVAASAVLDAANIPAGVRFLRATIKAPTGGKLAGDTPAELQLSSAPAGLDAILGNTAGLKRLVGTINAAGTQLALPQSLNTGLAGDLTIPVVALAAAREQVAALLVQRNFDLDVRRRFGSTTTIPRDDRDGEVVWTYANLPLDPAALTELVHPTPSRRSDALSSPIAITLTRADANPITATQVLTALRALFDAAALTTDVDPVTGPRNLIALSGGGDGNAPLPIDYAGEVDTAKGSTGLATFEDIEDISIVMSPGAVDLDRTNHQGVVLEVQKHVNRMRYRVGIVDARQGQTLGEVREWRSAFSDTRLALYYPWVRISDPTGAEIERPEPPAGFIAGLYARTDVGRGVHKAPANDVVFGALGFDTEVNRFQQELLNPDGVNCLRSFPGRGHRVWGARTLSDDPEWIYVNVRRYFLYLERSIDKSTQWAVFEPNGEQLWDNIRAAVDGFLFNEWRNGRLLGADQKEAYFVRCDRTTMTQNDLDNGRLVCLVGVAPLRPAEFVIFRIGQKTADAK